MNKYPMRVENYPCLIVLLTLLVALSGLSTDIYLPSLPDMASEFSTDNAHAQLTLTVYMLGFAFSMLIWGPISDRYGRRPVILVGISIHFIATLACLFATSIELLIAARFFQALGGCCGTVIGRVIVKDMYKGKEAVKVLSYIASGMALTPAIAPMIGGFIQSFFQWRVTFILIAIISLLLFVLSHYFLIESLKEKNVSALNTKKIFQNYGCALKNKNFLIYTFMISFAWTGYFSFLSNSAFLFIQQLHVSSLFYGFLYGLIVTSYIAGTFFARTLTSFQPIPTIVMLGATIAGTAGLFLLGVDLYLNLSLVNIMIPMMVYLIGIGLIMPTAQAMALESFDTIAGSVAGLLYFIEMMMGALAGFFMPMMVVVPASGVCMVILFYLLKRHSREACSDVGNLNSRIGALRS